MCVSLLLCGGAEARAHGSGGRHRSSRCSELPRTKQASLPPFPTCSACIVTVSNHGESGRGAHAVEARPRVLGGATVRAHIVAREVAFKAGHGELEQGESSRRRRIHVGVGKVTSVAGHEEASGSGEREREGA
jgi:hypothetical protein